MMKWTFLLLILQLINSLFDARYQPGWPVCEYPCQCAVRELSCDHGINVVKDGCGCCYMCARQHGDLCNVKDVCDNKQGLYCDISLGKAPGFGVCKANISKPCIVGNAVYQDGEQFKPECSRLCTCQNGNYGCVELCQDEFRVPSSIHCKQPRLLAVDGECCKQWTCDVHTRKSGSGGIWPRHVHYQGNPMELKTSSVYTGNSYAFQNTQPSCIRNVTSWSHCSRQCDVGVSTRTVTDSRCRQTIETRLCYLRPCDIDIKNNGKCTPTGRLPGRQHIHYEDCISVKDWNLKFCTACKRRRCCYPRREITRKLEFQCGQGRRETFSVMWIKSCRCDRQCYVKDPARKRKRNHG